MYYHAHFVDVRDIRDIIRDLCDICLKLLCRNKTPFCLFIVFDGGFETMRKTTPVVFSYDYATKL